MLFGRKKKQPVVSPKPWEDTDFDVMTRLRLWFINHPGQTIVVYGSAGARHIGHVLAPGWRDYAIEQNFVMSPPVSTIEQAQEWMRSKYDFRLSDFTPTQR